MSGSTSAAIACKSRAGRTGTPLADGIARPEEPMSQGDLW